MQPKHTKRASTYVGTNGCFLHIDRILVPIFVPWEEVEETEEESKTWMLKANGENRHLEP